MEAATNDAKTTGKRVITRKIMIIDPEKSRLTRTDERIGYKCRHYG